MKSLIVESLSTGLSYQLSRGINNKCCYSTLPLLYVSTISYIQHKRGIVCLSWIMQSTCDTNYNLMST